MTAGRLQIVGLGGTTTEPSSTERALSIALAAAEGAGAEIRMFGGAFLKGLPHYGPKSAGRTGAEEELLAAVRAADGLIIASPGYHGGVSGLVKNALDLLEDTAGDARPYLTGLPVGVIGTAYGWQAASGAVVALRAIAHALRAWPTPYAATINTQATPFGPEGAPHDDVRAPLELVARQVVEFATLGCRGAEEAQIGLAPTSVRANAEG